MKKNLFCIKIFCNLLWGIKQNVQKCQRKRQCESYKDLVDSVINDLYPELEAASLMLAEKKRKVYDEFKTVLELKSEIYGVTDQSTHTFTNSDGSIRIVIGNYTTDDYRDTVNDGIKKVKNVVLSLAKDVESKALVNTILKLLSKDQKGNLKASKVLQLSVVVRGFFVRKV